MRQASGSCCGVTSTARRCPSTRTSAPRTSTRRPRATLSAAAKYALKWAPPTVDPPLYTPVSRQRVFAHLLVHALADSTEDPIMSCVECGASAHAEVDNNATPLPPSPPHAHTPIPAPPHPVLRGGRRGPQPGVALPALRQGSATSLCTAHAMLTMWLHAVLSPRAGVAGVSAVHSDRRCTPAQQKAHT